MNITGTPFLFLFLPVCTAVYALLQKAPMGVRNGFLLAASLAFYAWGEPVRLALLLLLMGATWGMGQLCAVRVKTRAGKRVVLVCVLMNVGVLFFYKYLDFALRNIGYVMGHEFAPLGLSIPLGLSYFCFSSISYVVDVYRGRHKPQSLLNTALYLSVFFKMTAGPIVKYNQFEAQLKERRVTAAHLTEGVWRFAIGFCKKMIFSGVLCELVDAVFASDYAQMSVAMAWLGALAYMLQLYFDFSGYSDMAIGMGKLFGFEMPENFQYPYAARSVSTYWRRWHITLGEWFREYMYYPLTLGPAIRLRKRLMKRFDKKTSQFIQSLLVLMLIWSTTGLWHGARWNYLLWGVINGLFVFWESYKKPLKNARADACVGWLYTFMLSLVCKPLAYTPTLSQAAQYYGAMLGLYGNGAVCEHTLFLLREYGILLLAGLICAFPVGAAFIRRVEACGKKTQALVHTAAVIALGAAFLAALSLSVMATSTTFIYGNF